MLAKFLSGARPTGIEPSGTVRASLSSLSLALMLFAEIAEEQAQAADKMEKHTRKLVFLTWALLVLTATLLVYTVMLYQDSHQQTQGNQLQNDHRAKQP